MTDFITVEEIERGIDQKHRHFFRVSAATIPRGIAEAFWKATAVIAPAMWFSHPIHVIFASAPFSLNLNNGELIYTPSLGVINAHVEHIVFLDYNKMANFFPDIQVACILEELVHALMHISDEHLVSVVVSELYPAITWSDGKYSLKDITF
ncbi:hypothetical protein [Thiolinea disciformis]|uniref:hypothetical protein n=1 Tax=Thiolinea disciformis TaxID=125614 RepID=UPI00037FD3B7|nr:hypothetical protein [Thiolinea disciformis]